MAQCYTQQLRSVSKGTADWKKPISKGHILPDSIYRTFSKYKIQ